MITLSNDAPGRWAKGVLVASAALMTVLTALTLCLAKPLGRILGTTGINVVTRVRALIVASLAIDSSGAALRISFQVSDKSRRWFATTCPGSLKGHK